MRMITLIVTAGYRELLGDSETPMFSAVQTGQKSEQLSPIFRTDFQYLATAGRSSFDLKNPTTYGQFFSPTS